MRSLKKYLNFFLALCMLFIVGAVLLNLMGGRIAVNAASSDAPRNTVSKNINVQCEIS